MTKQSIKVWMMRHDNLVKAIMLGSIGSFLIIGVLIPSLGKTGELRRKILIRSKEEEKLTQKMRVINNMNKEALKDRLRVLDQALPPRKDVVLYLATVDGLSRELGLSFAGISLSPGDVTEASASSKTKIADIVKGVHVLETEIKINGSRDKIYEFLRVLEKTSPLMQIKDVQVSSLGVGEDSYILSLKLGMLWASRDQAKTSGVVELFTEKEEKYFQDLAVLRTFNNPFEIEGNGLDNLGKYDLFEPILPQIESLLEQKPLPEQELLQ